MEYHAQGAVYAETFVDWRGGFVGVLDGVYGELHAAEHGE